MALNRKLTPVIKGRKIESIEQAENLLSLHFADGSIMKIKTSAPLETDALTERTVKSIRQRNTTMNIDFDDGTTGVVVLAEVTSSVMLRDAEGVLEYAD